MWTHACIGLHYWLRVRAWFELAHVRAWFDGDTDAAVDWLRRALRLAEENGDRDLRIEGHMRLGTISFNAGRGSGAP